MRAAYPRPASTTGRVARALFVTLGLATILAGCSGSGLESISATNPSYASPGSSAEVDSGAAADRTDIVPLTAEQESQISTDTAFVPMTRPANDAVAVTQEVAAPTAQGTVQTAAQPETGAVAPGVAQATAADAAQPVATPAEIKPGLGATTPQAQAAPAATATASSAGQQQVIASSFAAPPQPTAAAKKQGFLAGLFAQKAQAAPVMSRPQAAAPKPVLQLASVEPVAAAVSAMPGASDDDPKQGTQSMGSDLPGVRKSSLFEITRKNGIDDDSDVDLHEDEESPVQMASAAGMGRLAPNGLLKQRESVDVSCLKPSLVRMLKQIESHYGKRFVVTSGYRSPEYNRKVRGARKSMHMYCAAVDVQLDGVTKWELARFARSMPGRGGVGTYCHTESVHIDVGPERDWNWRCRSRRKG